MNMNSGQFHTYKSLFPVRRTQTTCVSLFQTILAMTTPFNGRYNDKAKPYKIRAFRVDNHNLFAAFLPVFQKLVYRWGSGDNSYRYLSVSLFTCLYWEKRKTFEFG